LATLTQKQYNSNIQHIEFIEKTVEQLKIDQEAIFNKINEILFKLETHTNIQNSLQTATKARRRRKFKSANDISGTSSESEATNNNKLNPYDLTPTLVALIRNKMKMNEPNNEDSDESIEKEFSFDYSKPFTHKINQKILKSYLSFYIKDYETRGNNLSKSILIFYLLFQFTTFLYFL